MSFSKKQVSVVVLAGGSGSRMKSEENKLFLKIKGVPILYRTLYRLNQFKMIDSIVLVCRKSEHEKIDAMMKDFGNISKLKEVVEGGEERSDSVICGLKKIMAIQNDGVVMTHDGARPFISESLINSLLEAVEKDSISIPALRVFETVRKQDQTGITSVIDRSFLYTVQTPQVFYINQIQDCFLNKEIRLLKLTDEASYFETAGKKVSLVDGEKWNIKLTAPEDIKWAEGLIEQYNQLKLEGLEN